MEESTWLKQFPLCIKNSCLIKNKSTVRSLWVLNASFSFFDSVSGVEKYVMIIDIFGEERMKVRQFILYMCPSLMKSGKRTSSKIFLIPTSCKPSASGEELGCFSRIMAKLEEERERYSLSREKMEQIKR